jgi:carboxypeptidase Q
MNVDTEPLFKAGVPVMRNLIEDTPTRDYYFRYHHSAGDTMSVMNADEMDDNVVSIASMFFLIADMKEDLPRN